MRLRSTVNEIKAAVEVLYRNLKGKMQLSAGECDVVRSAIIDALQFCLLEHGMDDFKFHKQSVTVDTVADQSYVDLDSYTYQVIAGSVRIPAENHVLSLFDEVRMYQVDPDLDQTGLPDGYAYGTASDVDVMRLSLWPIPDAVYTLYMDTLVYPEDDIDEFPTWLASAIVMKVKALACTSLGLAPYGENFERQYESMISKVKDGHRGDQPRHVGIRLHIDRPYYGEERISG